LDGAGKLRHDGLPAPYNDAVSQRPKLAEYGNVSLHPQGRRLRTRLDQYKREFHLDQTLHRHVSTLCACPQSRWGCGFEHLDRQRPSERKGPHLIVYHGLIACMGRDFLHRFATWYACCQARHVPQKIPQDLAWHVHGELCFESHGVSPWALWCWPHTLTCAA